MDNKKDSANGRLDRRDRVIYDSTPMYEVDWYAVECQRRRDMDDQKFRTEYLCEWPATLDDGGHDQ